jgi:hypothetical protein
MAPIKTTLTARRPLPPVAGLLLELLSCFDEIPLPPLDRVEKRV